jgi:hypothetical protein
MLERRGNGGRTPRLGDWQLIIPLLQSWLDQWAALLSNVPEGMALAAILLPVVLAIFSKRLILVVGCILLAVIAFCAFAAPSNVATTLATGIYLASLVIALSGIVARRKAMVLQAEIASETASQRSDVNNLLVREDLTEQLRVVLRTREKKLPASSAEELPASGDPFAATSRAAAMEPRYDVEFPPSGDPFASTSRAPARERRYDVELPPSEDPFASTSRAPARERRYDGLVAGAMSIADIDKLMEELKTEGDYLQSEGERVRQLTARYAQLAQTASASVKIFAETLGKWRNPETVNEAPAATPRILAPAHDGELQDESNDQ